MRYDRAVFLALLPMFINYGIQTVAHGTFVGNLGFILCLIAFVYICKCIWEVVEWK